MQWDAAWALGLRRACWPLAAKTIDVERIVGAGGRMKKTLVGIGALWRGRRRTVDPQVTRMTVGLRYGCESNAWR